MTRGNIILCVGGAALLLAIALGFGWLWSMSGTRDSRTSPDGLVARLMKLKSAAVRDIRDGLEQGDLGRAERGVAELRRIGAASNWHLPDPRYSQFSDQFRQALDQLSEVLAAQDTQQLRGAYTALTSSCLACHEHTSKTPLDPRSLELSNSAAGTKPSDR